jgi:ribosomal protein S21
MNQPNINAAVILDPKKCTEKMYFDKMYTKFSRQVITSGVLDDLRLRRRFLTPSQRKKLKVQLANKRRFA